MELDAEQEQFFQRRIVRTMEKAFAIRTDPDSGSKMPALLTAILCDPDQSLVASSQEMAQELHDAQGASNPGGLVVVVDGTIRGAPFVGVMKLEHESGIRSEIVDDGGVRRFSIEIERSLVLTDNTRVFKAGVFIGPADWSELEDRPPLDPNLVTGWVSDDQASQGDAPVARFFREYLGCSFARAPEIDTQAFQQASEGWINQLEDGEKKTRYANALVAELASERKTLQPRTFAQDYLEVEDRDGYVEFLELNAVPIRGFVKDTRLIESKIRRTAVTTQGNVQVVATVEQFADGTVSIENASEGTPDTIKIVDKIKRVRGVG